MGLAIWSVLREARPPALVVRRPELCWAAALVGLAGLVALTPDGGLAGLVTALNQPQDVGRAVVKIACSAALATGFLLPAVFGERAGGLPRRVLAWAPVAFLGTVSYSLYLYHLTIAQLLGFEADPFHFEATGLGLADDVNTPVLLVLTLGLAAAVAAVSFRWVERPFFKPR
jgi:peptidoglycan/LPS O-acetylase OafA/YrhL